MGVFQRIRSWLQNSSERQVESGSPELSPQVASVAPRDAVNDAQGYGVAIVPATVAAGAWYWQAVRVHHLMPEENSGKHHIFLDLLDPATAPNPGSLGGQVYGAAHGSPGMAGSRRSPLISP